MKQATTEDTIIFDGFEVLPASPIATQQDPSEIIDLLVNRFEQSLIEKEYELAALRRQADDAQYDREGEIVLLRGRLEDAERSAEEARRELDAVNMVCRMLERENRRLTGEVEQLRQQLTVRPDDLLASLLTRPVA